MLLERTYVLTTDILVNNVQVFLSAHRNRFLFARELRSCPIHVRGASFSIFDNFQEGRLITVEHYLLISFILLNIKLLFCF